MAEYLAHHTMNDEVVISRTGKCAHGDCTKTTEYCAQHAKDEMVNVLRNVSMELALNARLSV